MSQATVLPLVLAAGLGTRMKSSRPKVLHELCGRPMLAYVLDAAEKAGAARPLVVYSPPTAAIAKAFADRADFALQHKPLGTADAVKAALAVAPQGLEEILVLSGDVPLVDPDVLAELIELRRARKAAMALMAVRTFEPEGLGRVVRDEAGGVLRIVEEKDASDEEREIDEINAGIYAFDAEWLRARIGDVAASPVSSEFYLPALVELAHKDRRPVVSLEVEDDGTLTGINDRAELADAELKLRMTINEAHMLAGVTMVDPASAYVDAGVQLGKDVTLEPNVILRGGTRVGDGTHVGSGSQITDSTVGRDCRIIASVIESCSVEDGARVGPFSHLRPGATKPARKPE
jgi:bifunctional UDP-N-acetylglucosamine pyrophosphorylase/glucosamine-1-phosphate N-acetyltransferase